MRDLAPGRDYQVTGLAVRDGVVEVRYIVRPGIPLDADQPSRTLLPRPVLRVPAPSPGWRVQGGFEPGDAESAGDVALYDPAIRAGEPVTLVLVSPADERVTLVLDA